MSILEILNDSSRKWHRNSPADETAIQRLLAESRLDLPADYLSFLRFSNGGEGTLGIKPGYFSLWPVEEVSELNQAYEVQQSLPWCFGFGSNGGGELLAFDTRGPQPWKIVMVPFVTLDEEDVWPVADDFLSFLKAVGCEEEGE